MSPRPAPERRLPPGSGLAIAFLFALAFWAVAAAGLSVAVMSRGVAPETAPLTQDLM